MTEIEDLQRRISAALDRVATGLAQARATAAPSVPRETVAPQPEAVSAAPEPVAVPETPKADPGEVAALLAALEEERMANAQLEERLRQLKDRGARELTLAQGERDAALARIAGLDETLQALRASQADLGQTVAQLRAALADNVAEPDLVNRAMQAEIEALRALRAADAAEIDAVIADLRPLVEEEN